VTPRQRGPVNLTAAAERMPWTQAQQTVRVLARADGLALEIRAVDGTEEQPRSPSLGDDIYVVISGYGALRCGEEVVECTAGDVVLAPSAVAHRFERLDGELKVWRISLARAAADPG
jgi:mannose-6-phosphate isomerase-like protein (cupin superfamily)